MKRLFVETRWHLIDAITGMIRAKRWPKPKFKGAYDEDREVAYRRCRNRRKNK